MIVAIDGPDGAGKSTQVGRLVDWARTLGLSARAIGKWDVFDPGAVGQARFLRGTDLGELRVCIAEMPSPARMLFLGWMNATAAERAREADEDLVVLDGYWIKHAASELLMGCHPGLVESIIAAIAPVDLIVYFDVTAQEALRRKGGDLTPYECGRDPSCVPKQFVSFQEALRQTMLDWALARDWPIVDADTPDAVQCKLRELIAPLLPR